MAIGPDASATGTPPQSPAAQIVAAAMKMWIVIVFLSVAFSDGAIGAQGLMPAITIVFWPRYRSQSKTSASRTSYVLRII